jgi:heme-degrading monooxygenase HmoA
MPSFAPRVVTIAVDETAAFPRCDLRIIRGRSIPDRDGERTKMIERVWHGWTTPENADAYEALVKDEVFPGIAARNIEGYRGMRFLRRPISSGEIEFVTLMTFDSLEAIRAFAGDDYETAHVPPNARAVLSRFDARSVHYEVRHQLEY